MGDNLNTLYLKNNPIVYQAENKINKLKNYFEGWYFKNSFENTTISFIPGLNIENKNKSCFIQIITNSNSYYIPYKFDDFHFSYNPFYIQIQNNYFSEDKIILDINDKNIKISGTLYFTNSIKLKKKFLCPNIMGPFSYFPSMECNHAILSLTHYINGSLKVNNQTYTFKNGKGYIEKDWGTSFPSAYTWCQGNNFSNNLNASLFLSIATIPLKFLTFKGFICVLYFNEKEYRFTTYNGSKIEKYNYQKNFIDICLTNKNYKLSVKAKNKDFSKLLAPQNGNMSIHVSESINSELEVILQENNNIIFKDTSINCGLEIKGNIL